MHKIFIDGQAGTTGLQIQERLDSREDIELLEITSEQRKDTKAKQEIMAQADVVVLCLPDAAAIEAVTLASSSNVRFLDASTAHRVNPDWAYGFAEILPEQRERIANARLVSNPGCYPTGFLASIVPLRHMGLVRDDASLTISAISGYSGGGRQMIEKYEAQASQHPENLWHARPYALTLHHKHVPEMQKYAGLQNPPLFLPMVGNFHQGMLVSTALPANCLNGKPDPVAIQAALSEYFDGEACVKVHQVNPENELNEGFLDPQAANHTNRVELFVFGHDQQIVVVARLDNLGKGASGAAVQNLNLMLDANELEGLQV